MSLFADLPGGLGVDRAIATDVLVVGSGVAGLSAALAARPRSVLVATKTRLASGSSPHAQGGIAAAIDPGDEPRLHAADTERAGRGLCERDVVRRLTEEAPEIIRELARLGVVFDRDRAGTLSLGREGGHGRNRVLHAGGDRTGAAIVAALVAAVRGASHVSVEEGLFAVDLLRFGSRVAGALTLRETGAGIERIALLAQEVVLATGGLGQIYRYTTNPPELTGDGIAMAARAGARLSDLEFVQFHPTTLRVEGEATLLTEALRGAGARLVDERGWRFLTAGELAPRDVVALGIARHAAAGHEVYLDLRDIDGLESRFPTVVASCRAAGLDPAREPVPVTPAAHYAMGGIAVDDRGRTSLDGLWACGETACSGAHGANRLASNSLLEALVFGSRLARTIRASTGFHLAHLARAAAQARPIQTLPRLESEGRDLAGELLALRELMWRHVGLERTAEGLASALTTLQTWHAERDPLEVTSRASGELRNATLVGALVTAAALHRKESRGAHVRTDYPEPRDELRHRIALRLLPGDAPLDRRVIFETLDSGVALAGAGAMAR